MRHVNLTLILDDVFARFDNYLHLISRMILTVHMEYLNLFMRLIWVGAAYKLRQLKILMREIRKSFDVPSLLKRPFELLKSYQVNFQKREMIEFPFGCGILEIFRKIFLEAAYGRSTATAVSIQKLKQVSCTKCCSKKLAYN